MQKEEKKRCVLQIVKNKLQKLTKQAIPNVKIQKKAKLQKKKRKSKLQQI